MLDAISVFLGAISILQNVKNKKTLKEKVDELQRASTQIRRIHDFLSEAKEFHDQFELLESFAAAPLISSVKNSAGNMNVIESALMLFIQQEKMVVTNRTLSPRQGSTQNLDDKTPVRNNLSKLDDIYPEFLASLDGYLKSISRLENLLKIKNFGQNLLDENDTMRDQAGRVRFNADQIILNTVPIIIFLQYELDNSIGSLTG